VDAECNPLHALEVTVDKDPLHTKL